MKDYFDSQEKVASLLFHAQSWLGTPWCTNSKVKGGAVSCHNLPRQLYIECGALTEDFPIIVSDPNVTRHKTRQADSEMVAFLDTRREFRRVEIGREPAAPGDLLGLRIQRCVDHLGVYLSSHSFIHTLMYSKTVLHSPSIHPWAERTLAIWRPVYGW